MSVWQALDPIAQRSAEPGSALQAGLVFDAQGGSVNTAAIGVDELEAQGIHADSGRERGIHRGAWFVISGGGSISFFHSWAIPVN